MKGRSMANRLAALALAVSLLLGACGGGARAATMHLRRSEGTVSVSDDAGKSLEPAENLGLFAGYGVGTRSESYAWIDLDEVKLTKLDQDSALEIKKAGKHLELEVRAGSLYFDVTRPLAEDETMEIRTANMLVGIRGTCGWVAENAVALLEGTVEVTAGDRTVTVQAGEMAVLAEDGTLTVRKLTAADVPAFVSEEAAEETLAAALPGGAAAWCSTDGTLPDEYAGIRDEIFGDILYAEIVDFEADGSPELMVLHMHPGDQAENMAISIYRNGPDGPELVHIAGALFRDSGTLSLAESGGRLYLANDTESHSRQDDAELHLYRHHYEGSLAGIDGADQAGSGGDCDWSALYSLLHSENTMQGEHTTRYDVCAIETGYQVNECTAEEYDALRGKFNQVKILAYSPDGKTLIIAPDPSEIADSPLPED